jgi:hypothetical protein
MDATKIAPELNEDLQGRVTVLNFISSQMLNFSYFQNFVHMEFNHDEHLHVEVRRLSRGRMLQRLEN